MIVKVYSRKSIFIRLTIYTYNYYILNLIDYDNSFPLLDYSIFIGLISYLSVIKYLSL